jgi:ribosomal protein S1
MTNAEITTEELKRKMHFKGKVVKTTLAGIIVDIGLDKFGVVHIANIASEPVKRVEDAVQIGDEVDVWVRRIKRSDKLIDLTMVEPLALEWREIKKGMVLTGQVVRLEKFGAFIEVGAERPGLAHISELTHDYIRKPEDAVNVGDEVEVKVIDFSRRKKQIKLSMKAMQKPPAQEEVEEVEETPVLTAMEIAYRRALEGQDEDGTPQATQEETKEKTVQDDIISRTLENKSKTK